MKHLLDKSVFLNGCSRFKNWLKTAVFGQKDANSQRPTRRFSSAIVDWMNRFHPALWMQEKMAQSRLCGWLYRYGGNLCAQPLYGLALFGALLAGSSAAVAALAQNWGAALLWLLGAAAAVLIFWRKESLANWLKGSWLLGRLPLPAGQAQKSVWIYGAACGAVGGIAGYWLGGWGPLLGVGLLIAPILVRIPPLWAVCLLCGALPLAETAICWVLSVWIVLLYFFSRTFGAQQGKPLDRWDLLLLLFPLLCIASSVFSYDVADSAKVSAMWIGLFICCFFVRRIVCSRKRLLIVLAALAVGAAASGIFGLWQFLSGQVDTTWTDTNLFEDLQLRVYSTFENPNVYGEFLLLAMPLVAGLALAVSGKKRWILWGVEGLLLINLILTYSRGCYVGLLLTALVFLWNVHRRWTIAALAMGIPIALVLMPASVLERIGSIGNMNDGSTAFRIYIYIGVALLLRHYWFCGVGLGEGAFNQIYPDYALPAINAPHSHSLFLQMVLSFGVLGLVYLIAVLKTYLKEMKQARLSAAPKDRWLLLSFGALIWGMLLQSAFDYTWYNYRIFQLFWIILALGFAAAEILKKKESENEE